mmetsp:Transcript_8833/g.32355  ORF Transcript_8833/g.32355 Transcript_8833/m.32355 type:complete len:81 (+) Transcript_8833:717-959(+)
MITLEQLALLLLNIISQVLNCIPSPHKRGQMLALAQRHLRPRGLLFLMIPRSCMENSTYYSFDTLTFCLANIGMTARKCR